MANFSILHRFTKSQIKLIEFLLAEHDVNGNFNYNRKEIGDLIKQPRKTLERNIKLFGELGIILRGKQEREYGRFQAVTDKLNLLSPSVIYLKKCKYNEGN